MGAVSPRLFQHSMMLRLSAIFCGVVRGVEVGSAGPAGFWQCELEVGLSANCVAQYAHAIHIGRLRKAHRLSLSHHLDFPSFRLAA